MSRRCDVPGCYADGPHMHCGSCGIRSGAYGCGWPRPPACVERQRFRAERDAKRALES